MAFRTAGQTRPTFGPVGGLGAREGDPPGFIEQASVGFLSGLREDVLVGPVVNTIANLLPDVEQEDLDELVAGVQGRPLASAANFMGQLFAMLPAFTAAGIAGRVAARAALGTMSKYAVKRGLATEGVGQIGKAAQKAGDIGGDVAKALPKLRVERAAEVVGGAAGFGALTFGEELLKGENAHEAAEQAAVAAVIGGVAETAIIGLGLITKRGRAAFVDQNREIAAAKAHKGTLIEGGQARRVTSGEVIREAQQEIRGGALAKSRDKIHKIIDVERQEMALVSVGGRADDVLGFIRNHPGATPAQLATALSVSTSYARGLLKRLADRELVKRSVVETIEQLPGKLTKAQQTLKAKGLLPETIEKRIIATAGGKLKRKQTFFSLRESKALEKRTTTIRRKPGATLREDLFTGERAGLVGRKDLKLTKAERKTLRQATQESRAIVQDIRILGDIEKGKPLNLMTRHVPFSHSSSRRAAQELLRKVFTTPEGALGSNSVTAQKVAMALKMADDEIIKELGYWALVAKSLQLTARKGLGLSAKEASEGGFLPIASKFETMENKEFIKWLSEVRGLTPKKAQEVGGAFVKIGKMENEMNRKLRSSGGQAEIEVASFGNKNYLTHVGQPKSEDDMMKILEAMSTDSPSVAFDAMASMRSDPLEISAFASMVKSLGLDPNKVTTMSELVGKVEASQIERAAAAHLKRGPDVTIKSRLPRFGAHDFTRTLGGTLESKATAGLPVIKDPFEGFLRYMQAGSRRFHTSRVVGRDGKLLDTFYDAVQVEGGDHIAFKNLVENYLNNDFYGEALRKWSKFATGLNVGSKMTMGVFANFTQPINIVFMNGITRTIKGMGTALGKEHKVHLEQMMALNHSMAGDIGRILGEDGIALTGAEKFAEFVLKFTGFSMIESGNRVMAGGTGHLISKELIAKGALGRLRGNSLDSARRRARDLGFELDPLIGRLRGNNTQGTLTNLAEYFSSQAGRDLNYKAAFLMGQKTQFIPSKFRRPEVWNHPLGRVVFQFKTFALQQTRLIRDQVLAEAAAGNVAPIAYFLALAPVAGEFVADARAVIRGDSRPNNMQARVFENILSVGGMGLAGDLYQAARWGDFGGFFLGPTADTAFDMIQSVATMDASVMGRTVAKMPITQVTMPFIQAVYHTPEMIENYVNATTISNEDPFKRAQAQAEARVIDRQQLLQNALDSKGTRK